MKNRYQCEIISGQRNQELTRFFAQADSANGAMQVQLDHSPDFWASLDVLGGRNKVIVAYDRLLNQIAGTMIVSQKDCFFQGELRKTVYVSGLKIGIGYEHSAVLALVFKMLRICYQQAAIKTWFFSVFANNQPALRFFTKGHKLCPYFLEMGFSNTHVFTKRILPGETKRSFDIGTANEADVVEIRRFIESEGLIRSNLPNYSSEELKHGRGLLKDFQLKNLAVARRGSKIIGLMGLWDQTRYRRWLVKDYSRLVKLFRPLINWVGQAMRYPSLPAPNHPFLYKILCLILIQNDDVVTFKHLFNYLMGRESGEGANYIVTLNSDSPFDPLFKKKSVSFSNVLFKTGYAENFEYLNNLNQEKFYIEQGGL